MQPIVGVFRDAGSIRGIVDSLGALGIPSERLNVLTPGAAPREVRSLPTSGTEPPGQPAAIGGVIGGSLGLGLGASLLLVPGVGPVTAAGALAAAILGIGGAAVGAKAGAALDEVFSDGLPADELYVYEDALRSGRTIVLAFCDDDAQAKAARDAMAEHGAESLDAARENWWVGLRDAEKLEYEAGDGKGFEADEPSFRRGFETALSPRFRGRSFEDSAREIRVREPELGGRSAFRRGYERGLRYFRAHRGESGDRALRERSEGA